MRGKKTKILGDGLIRPLLSDRSAITEFQPRLDSRGKTGPNTKENYQVLSLVQMDEESMHGQSYSTLDN
jgi:hypothetical protein